MQPTSYLFWERYQHATIFGIVSRMEWAQTDPIAIAFEAAGLTNLEITMNTEVGEMLSALVKEFPCLDIGAEKMCSRRDFQELNVISPRYLSLIHI